MNRYYTTDEQIKAKMQELDTAIASNGKQPWTMRRVFKMISSMIFAMIFSLLLFVLVSIWYDRSQGITPSILGYQIYRVETGSMIPTFPIGSVIICKEYDGESQLEIGQVVTFSRGDKIITHRVIEILDSQNGVVYRTKGDNPENDPDLELLTKDNIIALYKWNVPFLVQVKTLSEGFAYE